MGGKKKPKGLESEKKTLKKVDLKMLLPKAKKVSLAGDFNNWNVKSHPLKKDSKGMWKISIDLVPGRYEYRFIVDGKWQNDPNCTTCVPNPLGGENCMLELR